MVTNHMVLKMKSQLSRENRGELGVYIIHNSTTDETYIGSGVLGKRLSKHKYLLENGKHFNYRLQQAYNKNNDFEFIPVPIEGDRNNALEAEQSLINEHWGNPLLLNILQSVDQPMTGFKHSEESVEKNRQAALKRWQDPEYYKKVIAAQNAGRAAMTSEEIAQRNAKLSSSLKAAYANDVRRSTAGQVRSEEFCQANSSKITEKWQDPKYRERQRQARIEGGNMVRQGKEVLVGDTIYPSLSDAGKAHGITKQSAGYRIKSDKYPDWILKDRP